MSVQYIEDEARHEDFELSMYKRTGGTLPVVRDLRDLVAELNKAFETNYVDVELVHFLMKSYKSNPSDWKKYAKFDRYRYTRNLVDNGNGKYNLMILCWGEGHGSGIHDHSNSHCFMKMLQGSLEEIRFSWPERDGEEEGEGELREIRRKRLELNDVCYINDSLGLHRVENVSNVDTAISLHLYCPPYDQCSVFSQNTGKRSTATVTFYSMFGKRNKENQAVSVPEDN